MNIFLIGYGKMGKAVQYHAELQGHTIIGHATEHEDLYTSLLDAKTNGADVVVEFTQPEAAFDNIKTCLKVGLPVVSGTTGWLHQKPELDRYCAEVGGTYLQASNFSIGVHLYLNMCQQAAMLMQNHPAYHASITESHHTEKKDMPSGTALLVQEATAQGLPMAAEWHLTNELVEGEHGKGIGITSLREPGVPGTHTLLFSSPEDNISLVHHAHNRDGFAKGAVYAATWIVGKKGVFTMQQVLGL